MASLPLCGDCGEFPADDVLYDYRRLDADLFLQNAERGLCGTGRRGRQPGLCKSDHRSSHYADLDADHHSSGISGLFYGTSERRGKDQQVYDGGTFPADGSAGSEFQPSAGSFRRFEVLSASGFRKADGLSHF